MKAPTGDELTRHSHTVARRVGRFLQRQGLLEFDAENSNLSGEALDDESMAHLRRHFITYGLAVGPHQGRKVFTLQTLPSCTESFDAAVGKVAGFSLHAGVAARALNARNWSVCAATSQGLQCLKSDCRY